jgi:GTP:adenosylcobinamide-phosphate guanylyltransferase
VTPRPHILVLAGRRSAALDPLAEKAGVSHKCMVPVLGEAMVGRVLRAVDEAFPDSPLYLSIEDFSLAANEPTVSRLHEAGRLTPVAAQHNLVDSLIEATRVAGFPLLITTADNVLMTVEGLHSIAERGSESETDGVIMMAREKDIMAAHSDGQRRFYRFRDGGFSNCNLFWITAESSLHGTAMFRHGGQFAKKKSRAVRTLGLMALLLYITRAVTLDGMFRHIGRRLGIKLVPLVTPDGRLAIDVDNERTHRVAEEILARG